MIGIRAVAARLLPQGAILLVDPDLRARTSRASSATGSSPAPTAPAPSSTPTTRRSCCPELLLDVLVAAGLTAPFVPVFTTLRGDATRRRAPVRPDRAHARRGRDARSRCLVLFFLAPASVAIIAPGFDAQSAGAVPRAVPADAGHADPVRGVDHARRDPRRRAPVPVLRPRADPLQRRDRRRHGPAVPRPIGILAAAVGAVLGASLHLGIRVVGMHPLVGRASGPGSTSGCRPSTSSCG